MFECFDFKFYDFKTTSKGLVERFSSPSTDISVVSFVFVGFY